ncbi:MAG: 16S rRNA (cytidine(1402)-2'-O)-methyltransferase [Candidatus Melainabacteria bacterium]|nr:16S rRNA (cytidine(1402)-2'-O)-methyltransferase [Candidatus Melainabacteria bacterium]
MYISRYRAAIFYMHDRSIAEFTGLWKKLTVGLKGGVLSGTLFIISTPIGNLEDISERAKRTMSEADLLLVEDTRVTIKLLNHLGIHKKMISCHKFNEEARRELLVAANADNQKVALISDAGTPLISDPGQRIVAEAIELGMDVIAIPGPTAFVQALVGSGLPCDRFVFEGFLPEKDSAVKAKLKSLVGEERTLVFYVSPHGLRRTIAHFHEALGERRVCLARELTKRFEEYIRCNLSELESLLTDDRLRGEFALVIEGAESKPIKEIDPDVVRTYVLDRFAEDTSSKEITADLVANFGMRKSEAYELVLGIKKEVNG